MATGHELTLGAPRANLSLQFRQKALGHRGALSRRGASQSVHQSGRPNTASYLCLENRGSLLGVTTPGATRQRPCSFSHVLSLLRFELEFELIQTQMAQKPMLRGEVG